VFLLPRALRHRVPPQNGSDEIETCGRGNEDKVFHGYCLDKRLSRNILPSLRLSTQRNTLERPGLLWATMRVSIVTEVTNRGEYREVAASPQYRTRGIPFPFVTIITLVSMFV
jgi:hypothetical protein